MVNFENKIKSLKTPFLLDYTYISRKRVAWYQKILILTNFRCHDYIYFMFKSKKYLYKLKYECY